MGKINYILIISQIITIQINANKIPSILISYHSTVHLTSALTAENTQFITTPNHILLLHYLNVS